jgi:hypothetical protein
MEHEHETIKPSAGVAEVDGAGTATGTAAGPAAATTPAPSRPDPLDGAAYRIAATADGPATTFVVPLDAAKRIRDTAVADLTEELDGLYRTLADASRAIGRHLPPGDETLPSITAAIKAVADHAYAQGAARAMASVEAALDAETAEELPGMWEWSDLSGGEADSADEEVQP